MKWIAIQKIFFLRLVNIFKIEESFAAKIHQNCKVCCGLVGRAVTSNNRDPQFESSHWQLLLNQYFLLTVCKKTKIKKKMPGMAHLKINIDTTFWLKTSWTRVVFASRLAELITTEFRSSNPCTYRTFNVSCWKDENERKRGREGPLFRSWHNFQIPRVDSMHIYLEHLMVTFEKTKIKKRGSGTPIVSKKAVAFSV